MPVIGRFNQQAGELSRFLSCGTKRWKNIVLKIGFSRRLPIAAQLLEMIWLRSCMRADDSFS